MNDNKRKSLIFLSVTIALLMAFASAASLLLPDIYRDNRWITSQLLGNDAVSLFIAFPVMLFAVYMANRNSFSGF